MPWGRKVYGVDGGKRDAPSQVWKITARYHVIAQHSNLRGHGYARAPVNFFDRRNVSVRRTCLSIFETSSV